MTPTLLSSPLQGFTDFRFRKYHRAFFDGIDHYMAPYLRRDGKGQIKASLKRDLLPENNASLSLLPQVMPRNADDFLELCSYVAGMGYEEVNWNLGCPYPMVAKRGMGSGMLPHPERIDALLKRVSEESELRISVKMRLGYEDPAEILRVLPVLDQYPLGFICIHPRIGKQLYKGELNLEAFEACLGQSRHPIYHNGDIHSVETFREMQERFPSVDTWLLGRGMIADPFLPGMIKADTTSYPRDAADVFSKFHEHLLGDYAEALSGEKHLLQRMYGFWEYFIRIFPRAGKGLKLIRKAKNLSAYREEVRKIIATGIGD